MSDSPDAAPDVSRARGQCVRCGYDLRGSDSDACPECGTPTSFPIEVNNPQQFHLAKAALERDGLLVRFVNPGGVLGTLGTLYGGDAAGTGYLWVDAGEPERVEQCLAEAGIAWHPSPRPIVDRSEPQCPSCGMDLDPQGPEICSHCAAHFQWIEIDEPALSTAGKFCECEYDLTGVTGDHCPECGRAIDFDLSDIAEQAVAPRADARPRDLDSIPTPEPPLAGPPPRRTLLHEWPGVIIVVTLMVFFLALSILVPTINDSGLAVFFAALGSVVLMAVVIAIDFIRRGSRS